MPDIRTLLFAAFLCLTMTISSLDLLADLSHGANTRHLVYESITLILGFFILTWLANDYLQQRSELKLLKAKISRTKGPPESSKELTDARSMLAKEIIKKFKEWKLTPSETEIAYCLLKGLSLKETAALRGTSERTIRQQASSIYQKSGTDGRHAFSAWFIEDLL